MKVVVLGGTGMLGSMTAFVLAREPKFDLTVTRRNETAYHPSHYNWVDFDANMATENDCRRVLAGAKWAVNCIGIIKPLIKDDDSASVTRAIRVNGLFPHTLAAAAEREGCRVISIGTDCVYSGAQGRYPESAPHDALDVYGKTKSLGEVNSPAVHTLRTSIIGPEVGQSRSLLDWFIHQPRGAKSNGFTNHQWNGVTTLHFARIALGIMRNDLALPSVHHLTPADVISKHELLDCFRRSYDRMDIELTPTEAKTKIDRTLCTENPSLNFALWQAAGHRSPLTIENMVEVLAQNNGLVRSGMAA